MFNRIVQGNVLAAALLIASAIPAAAQGAASAGVAFADDNLGVGIDADYARQYKSMTMDRTMSWLVDGAFTQKRGLGTSNTVLLGGGVRLEGQAGDNATWHVQGTAGFMRTSLGGGDLCDLLNLDCRSVTDFMIMPAGAVAYWFSDTKGVKGQLGIPLAVGGDSSRTSVRFDINFVWKLK